MKPILYTVAIIAACGAAFFSFSLSKKFKALEKERIETIALKDQTNADADVADKNIKDEKKKLADSQEKQESLNQSVAFLKSAGNALSKDLVKQNEDLKGQENEFAVLEKALAEVNKILAGLGGGVTLDTLPEKIQQIEDDKKAKQTKFEELEVLITGADKSLLTNNAELDRLSKRILDRNSRIGRNSMEAVVTAVNQDWGFLVIGAGSNSSFTPQTPLLVERDGKVLGRVSPSSVEATQTIAEIDLESLASGVRLQPGDRVILAQPLAN
jgi:DNA repair exonuclease SbcCD ATPase subunit